MLGLQSSYIPHSLVFACIHNNNLVHTSSHLFKMGQISHPYLKHISILEWCGHCKRLAPIWEELAEKVAAESNSEKITISKVDVPKYRAVGDRFQVRGYPALKLFDGNGKMYDYKGPRKLDDLYAFVTGGYQSETPADEIPVPPSWLSLRMKEVRQYAKKLTLENKHLSDLIDDFSHILDFRKNAAALLLGIGLVLGILFGYILGLSSGKKAGKKAKSD
jgi:thiol-disulfide isomerase/thioredoxin